MAARQYAPIRLWTIGSLRDKVEKYGNALFDSYLAVAREMMAEKAAEAGYKLTRWTGYYTGFSQMMTHYAAVFER